MRIGSNGVVVNEYGQLLLIRRNDTFTMAPPGGSIEDGELPIENVTREVREETGLIVMAVRLVGVYTWRSAPDDVITFVFRCIQRGGELATSEESPQVGFFPTDPLPGPMIPFHRHRLQQALRHEGGPPIWEHYDAPAGLRLGNFILRRIVYSFMNLRRRLGGMEQFETPPVWKIESFAVIQNDDGEALWLKGANGQWLLPGGNSHKVEPPWVSLVGLLKHQLGLELSLDGLPGVYHPEGENTLQMVFTAKTSKRSADEAETESEWCFFAAGAEPEGANPYHKQWVVDAAKPGGETVFRHQGSAGAEE